MQLLVLEKILIAKIRMSQIRQKEPKKRSKKGLDPKLHLPRKYKNRSNEIKKLKPNIFGKF